MNDRSVRNDVARSPVQEVGLDRNTARESGRKRGPSSGIRRGAGRMRGFGRAQGSGINQAAGEGSGSRQGLVDNNAIVDNSLSTSIPHIRNELLNYIDNIQ